MTVIDEALDELGEKSDRTALGDAHVALLNAAKSWMHDFELEDNRYLDGREMSAYRMLKAAPWGRAIVQLAEVLVAGND